MQGKVVIVTGASSGIGRAAALLFANKGSKVVAIGRSEKELLTLGKGVKSKTGSINIHLADMTQMSQLERIASETVHNYGQIDVLINSAI
jgi:short-subunit dehydrogenase